MKPSGIRRAIMRRMAFLWHTLCAVSAFACAGSGILTKTERRKNVKN